MKTLICVLLALCFTCNAYAFDYQEYKDYVNQTVVKKGENKDAIRLEWTEAFGGTDIWGPYYEFKLLEKKFKEHLTIKFFGMVGKPDFGDEYKQFVFVFKKAF